MCCPGIVQGWGGGAAASCGVVSCDAPSECSVILLLHSLLDPGLVFRSWLLCFASQLSAAQQLAQPLQRLTVTPSSTSTVSHAYDGRLVVNSWSSFSQDADTYMEGPLQALQSLPAATMVQPGTNKCLGKW
jgi:hypothetical protein